MSILTALPFVRPWRVSDKGVAFIAGFEGFPREQPYNDPVGHCTVGFGRLLHRGNCTAEDRRRWAGITRAQAMRLLREDLKRYAAAVRRLVKPKLNQAQFDALVSFTFNNGIGALEDSTLLRELNTMPGTRKGIVSDRNLDRVERQLLRWNKAGDPPRPMAGLTRRRRAEARLFRTGRYS